LNVSAAPLLIEVTSMNAEDLAAEDGRDSGPILTEIDETLREYTDYEDVLQQCNFRLRRPVPADVLKIWLINLTLWHPYRSEYTLYELPAKEGRRAGA